MPALPPEPIIVPLKLDVIESIKDPDDIVIMRKMKRFESDGDNRPPSTGADELLLSSGRYPPEGVQRKKSKDHLDDSNQYPSLESRFNEGRNEPEDVVLRRKLKMFEMGGTSGGAESGGSAAVPRKSFESTGLGEIKRMGSEDSAQSRPKGGG